jgi:hypothetical protein
MEKKIKQVLVNNMELFDEGTSLMGIPNEETKLEIIAHDILKLFAIPVVSGSLLLEKCKLIETTDDFISCDVTDCCNIGPIVNENYCPKCGKMIIRNDR